MQEYSLVVPSSLAMFKCLAAIFDFGVWRETSSFPTWNLYVYFLQEMNWE